MFFRFTGVFSVFNWRSVGLFPCCLQQFPFSLCSGVQILTLLLISVERLLAIAFPFKMRNEEWILFIWACGLRSSVADNVIMPVTSCASIYKGHQGHARTALVCTCCSPSGWRSDRLFYMPLQHTLVSMNVSLNVLFFFLLKIAIYYLFVYFENE